MIVSTFVWRVGQTPQERELVGWRGGEVESGQGGHEPHLEGQLGVLLTTQQDRCLGRSQSCHLCPKRILVTGLEIGFMGWLQHSFIV